MPFARLLKISFPLRSESIDVISRIGSEMFRLRGVLLAVCTGEVPKLVDVWGEVSVSLFPFSLLSSLLLGSKGTHTSLALREALTLSAFSSFFSSFSFLSFFMNFVMLATTALEMSGKIG